MNIPKELQGQTNGKKVKDVEIHDMEQPKQNPIIIKGGKENVPDDVKINEKPKDQISGAIDLLSSPNNLIQITSQKPEDEILLKKCQVPRPNPIQVVIPNSLEGVVEGKTIDTQDVKVDQKVNIPVVKGHVDTNNKGSEIPIVELTTPSLEIQKPSIIAPIIENKAEEKPKDIKQSQIISGTIQGKQQEKPSVINKNDAKVVSGGVDNYPLYDNLIGLTSRDVSEDIKLNKQEIPHPKLIDVHIPSELTGSIRGSTISQKPLVSTSQIELEKPTISIPIIKGGVQGKKEEEEKAPIKKATIKEEKATIKGEKATIKEEKATIIQPSDLQIGGGINTIPYNETLIDLTSMPIDEAIKLKKIDIPKPNEIQINLPEKQIKPKEIPEKEYLVDQELEISPPKKNAPEIKGAIGGSVKKVEPIPVIEKKTDIIEGGISKNIMTPNLITITSEDVNDDIVLHKYDIPKMKNIPFKLPEKPKTSEISGEIRGSKIDINADDIVIENPKIPIIKGNINKEKENKVPEDITISKPIISSEINAKEPTIDLSKIETPKQKQSTIAGGISNLPYNETLIDMTSKPTDSEIELKRVSIPHPCEIKVKIPEQQISGSIRGSTISNKQIEPVDIEKPSISIPIIKGSVNKKEETVKNDKEIQPVVIEDQTNIGNGINAKSVRPDLIGITSLDVNDPINLCKIDPEKMKEINVKIPTEILGKVKGKEQKQDIELINPNLEIEKPSVILNMPQKGNLQPVEVKPKETTQIIGSIDNIKNIEPLENIVSNPVDDSIKLNKIDYTPTCPINIHIPSQLEGNIPGTQVLTQPKNPQLSFEIDEPNLIIEHSNVNPKPIHVKGAPATKPSSITQSTPLTTSNPSLYHLKYLSDITSAPVDSDIQLNKYDYLPKSNILFNIPRESPSSSLKRSTVHINPVPLPTPVFHSALILKKPDFSLSSSQGEFNFNK